MLILSDQIVQKRHSDNVLLATFVPLLIVCNLQYIIVFFTFLDNTDDMLNSENTMVKCIRSNLFLSMLLAQVPPTHKNPPLRLKLFCVKIALRTEPSKENYFLQWSLNHFKRETSNSQGGKRKHHGSTTIARNWNSWFRKYHKTWIASFSHFLGWSKETFVNSGIQKMHN